MLTASTSEEQFKSFVICVADDPSRQPELIELLREDHPVFNQRGAATITRMRGWILLSLARTELPDAALPFVLEELDTGVNAYSVAVAAAALRSYPIRDTGFAPFVVRAISNIRYRDESLCLATYGGYAIGSKGTSPLRELFTTLTWLGPSAAPDVANELELLRTGPSALGKKYQSQLEQTLSAICRADDFVDADCCRLPNSLRSLFATVHRTRTTSAAIESTIFEDQDGQSITFSEFFHGQPSIVAFFYTRCDNPLKCSLTITKLARVQKLLALEGVDHQINTAAISYDPGFDLPERIRNYGEHRGVSFGERHRMLRPCDGLDSLRRHFQLGVNFIESLVNRHRLELFILDDEGRIAASFERIQWDEREVVERAIETLKDDPVSENLAFSLRKTRKLASPLINSAVALSLALFPKCPLCWTAYLSLFGIAGVGSIPYSPWLQPVLALLLLINLTSVWFRTRALGRMSAFYLVMAGALAVITSNLFGGPAILGIIGVMLTLVGSLWSVLSAVNQHQVARS